MRFFLYLLLALIPITSMAFDQKADCPLEKILFQAGPGNKCLESLATKVKDPDDRKFILEMQKTWNPPKDLKIEFVSNGIVAYSGGKMIMDGRWISQSPAIIFWNGKIKFGPAQVRGSLRQMIHAMIHDEKMAAVSPWLALLPFANAANDSSTAENMFTLFTATRYLPWRSYDAQSLLELRFEYVGQPGHSTYVPKSKTGKVQCTKTGIDADYDLSDFVYQEPILSKITYHIQTKEVALGKYLMTGIIPGKTILVQTMKKSDGTYEFSSSRDHTTIDVCADPECKTHEPIGTSINLAKSALGDDLLAQDKKSIVDEMAQNRPKYITYLKSNGVANAEALCTENSCPQYEKNPDRPTYAELDAHAISLDDPDGQLKSNLSVFGSNLWTSIGATAVDAIAFGECCKHYQCAEAMQKKLNIELNPPTESPGTTQ